jgi:AcrR family transcriptional regulator
MTAQASRRTQAERRSESERGLVEAAIEVIARQGVGAVTFEALGRTSGFSRGLATQRFGSKQGLLEAVLSHLHEGQGHRLRHEHRLDALPGLQAVLAYVDVCLRDLAARPQARAYFMLLSSAVAEADEARSAFFRETHAQVEAQLTSWVVRGQAEGAIRMDVDPGATALMIGCLMFGMSMQLLVDPAMDIGPIREMSLSMLKARLCAQPMGDDA